MTVEGPDILLVEDDPDDADLTLHALRAKKIVNTVHVVRDGAEALEFLFRNGRYAGRPAGCSPKVIMLDVKLPKVDGMEVLERVKRDPELHTVPVVMLTSSREERDIVASYNLGVNSYIVKPVDFDKFADAVRAAGMYWLLLNRPPINNRPGAWPGRGAEGPQDGQLAADGPTADGPTADG